MKKPIWAGTCAAIFAIASIAMSAQNPPSNSTPQGRSESTDRKVTVTGCLEAAPQSATPAAPAAEARNDQAGAAKAFVLTNAAASADAPPAADAAAPRTFRLVANEAALSPHAGKKVELTGTVQNSDSSSRNSSAAATADSSAPQLVVESGKVLAAKCTE
jgi:hypothetical protein